MKIRLLILMICTCNFLHAQDTTRVRVLSIDSLKKYHIGIAKTDSNTIPLAKITEKTWPQMSVGEKAAYIVKLVVNDYRKNYPFTFWILVTLLSLWILKQISRAVKKFNQ
ncbi:hypothetical protein [Ferruginibacter sp. SUN106]|uniref:hypothetical protein n=1 Tax=Ferruginibacter sp. SUN106 TaxID=2978348 RepID=UPI003D3688BA